MKSEGLPVRGAHECSGCPSALRLLSAYCFNFLTHSSLGAPLIFSTSCLHLCPKENGLFIYWSSLLLFPSSDTLQEQVRLPLHRRKYEPPTTEDWDIRGLWEWTGAVWGPVSSEQKTSGLSAFCRDLCFQMHFVPSVSQVSFYNVDAKIHIYTFNDTFNECIYPFFSPCSNKYGKNDGPLIITPVMMMEWLHYYLFLIALYSYISSR